MNIDGYLCIDEYGYTILVLFKKIDNINIDLLVNKLRMQVCNNLQLDSINTIKKLNDINILVDII